MKAGELLASVDLGSNSFRLLIVKMAKNGSFTPIDQIKETVRLASALDSNNCLSEGSVVDNALHVLSRFGERLVGIDSKNIRIVGTSTLREAKNSKIFVEKGDELLQFPIEVISGNEEARLVYIGAMHSLPYTDNGRLVVDIGGGSTEFIVGNGYQPRVTESITMGCVSFVNKFFADGLFSSGNFDRAILHARSKIQAKKYLFKDIAWVEAVGTSGSARTLFDICVELGFGNDITYAGLLAIQDKLLEFGGVDKIKFLTIKEDRKPVLASGLSIMLAVFKEFKIDKMIIADGALREGVLYDLIGRFDNHDLRESTIDSLLKKYEVDADQAIRVRDLANYFYLAMGNIAEVNHHKLFNWAAEMSEIGLTISHSAYQKHGAYILENSDLSGFSKSEQKFMADLVRLHRGSYTKFAKKMRNDPLFIKNEYFCMLVAFRLSIIFNRSRSGYDHRKVITIKPNRYRSITISCDQEWLKQNKLTKYSLEEEINELRDVIGFTIDYQTI